MIAKIETMLVNCGTCGKQFETTQARRRNGRGKYCSKTCGNRATSTKHGHTTKTGQSRTYSTWAGMLQRCTNPKAEKYSRYGGAGIDVCDEWRSFARFLKDMGERPDGKTLDRIDSDKGYSKENCRWATPAEQQSHLRSNVIVWYRGEKFHLAALARKLGLKFTTLKYRINSGWPESRWAEQPSPKAR